MADAGILIEGCGTAIVSPFLNGALDLDGLTRLVEAQIAGGVDFIVPCGTTGESPTLTDPERVAVIERTVEIVDGRVPVVAGTGTNDTPHSIAMTKAARAAGADACLAVVPYYNKPGQEGIYRHFRAMIDEGGLPAVLYHIPGRCVVGIDIDTIARTYAAGGVVGLKETGSVERITALRATCDVPIFSGDDGLTFPMICMGAAGVISVASNAVPAPVAQMVRHARAGAVAKARAIHDALTPLFVALFLESNPAPVKAALKELGVIASDEVRLPLTVAGAETRARVTAALAAVPAST